MVAKPPSTYSSSAQTPILKRVIIGAEPPTIAPFNLKLLINQASGDSKEMLESN